MYPADPGRADWKLGNEHRVGLPVHEEHGSSCHSHNNNTLILPASEPLIDGAIPTNLLHSGIEQHQPPDRDHAQQSECKESRCQRFSERQGHGSEARLEEPLHVCERWLRRCDKEDR